MKIKVFAGRNIKELLCDPLSYIFCLGLPIVMLLIMSLINNSIPAEANMTAFKIENLSAGIAVFSFSFVMLFGTLQTSKDRSTAFLTRLYASPMKAADYILGYALPLVVIAAGQCVITFLSSAVVGIFTDYTFNFLNVILATIVLIPCAILFIGFGLMFGSLFNDKLAPPITSVIITVSSLAGGIWMDIEAIGGVLRDVCNVLPFYPAVKAARAAISGNYSEIGLPLLIVSGYAIVIVLFAVFGFKMKMQADIK